MGRLGCFPDEVVAIASELKNIPGVAIAGLATHFAKAGPPGSEFTGSQIDKFDEAIAALETVGIRPEIIHASKSGTINHPRPRYDMVRLGMIAYGVAPAVEGFVLPAGVRTALTWHARITSTKILPKGHGISYGAQYVMPKDARVGILPVGYADGYRRVLDVNSVLIDGQERKILGSVNMDQCIVDLDGFPDITGNKVDLIGRQGDKKITVQYLAQRWNTNSYSVYTSIHTRVPRRVVGSVL
jgi:alanine racemase